ncbi:protein white isoform X2 [Folsomia candida]|uniref:Protein white n=1 Tax=Folsomia candida TaxID=158441 RepID=A0A226EH97_FOLCA|nr:protein white isoform X2 [Folsomia candida]OXA56819.1 Protein white [Folsomia candida]
MYQEDKDTLNPTIVPFSTTFSGNQGDGKLTITEPITYTWNNVNVWVGSGSQNGNEKNDVDMESGIFNCFNRKKNGVVSKQILRNVTGIVRPGELLAIMGASGAGKTTLLNQLTFRNTGKLKMSGEIKINGVAVSPDIITSVSAYVQQEDLFISTLTVREHLVFTALVRMDKHLTYKQRMQRVDSVIQELGLTKCAETIIGMPGRVKGISGGEMKRLAFASEVLTDCQLWFCDEVTSGLDSYMASNVIELLKEMASKGKTIICTIHQPSSEVYAMFDRVLLMAEGRSAFLGDAKEAVEFFKLQGYPCPPNYNPADFFIQTLAIQSGIEEECLKNVRQICNSFDSSDTARAIKTSVEEIPPQNVEFFEMQAAMKSRSPYKASWVAQFRAVLWRSWMSMIKEPMVIRVRLIQTLVIALILGAIYFGQELDQKGVMNLNGALFLFLTNMTFQNVFAVINVFCVELPIFLREHFNGMYRTDVYFLSKTLAEVPLYILFPFGFISITYYMVGFNPDFDRFLIACLVVVLVANVACSFGYMISCISGSVTMALSLAPPLIIPFMLFGGFFLNKGSIPVYFVWLRYLSWFNYGNEALAINQWRGVDDIKCDVSNLTCPRNGDVILETLNFEKDNLTIDIVSLVALLIGYRVIAFIALLAKTYRKT